MTYEEHLKSLGATEEEIKVIVTPVSRRAFEKQQGDLQAAEAARVEAERLKKATDDWYYQTHVPEFQAKDKELVIAKAEAARAKAALMAAQEQGLLDVAKDLGYEVNPPNPNPNPNPNPAVDMSKYVDRDTLLQVAEREGDAIALAQDIAAEHSVLFPGQRLSFRELRKEAMQRKIPVEQLWKDKYKVDDARAAKAAADQAAYDKKLRDEGAAAARAEFARTGNPDLTHPQASRSPFTPRPAGDARQGKQPWDAPSEHVLSDDRVRKVAAKIAVQ